MTFHSTLLVFGLLSGLSAYATVAIPSSQPLSLSSEERLLTILSTNDIHGGLEPSRHRSGEVLGGMAQLAGVVQALRTGLQTRYADRAGSILLDGGDQFQGTLLSNINEGRLMMQVMSEIGYTAAVPGNHDYDFGPRGWLDDKITEGNPDNDPRGALREALKNARFPLLSANTFLKASLGGAAVEGVNCEPRDGGVVNWEGAQSPDFLKPYLIVERAGLRVAIIGIDNPHTPKSTTPENISDLCFDDPVRAYLRVREKIAEQADVFVLLAHDGNSDKEFSASEIVRGILAARPQGVDAMVAGHTHFVNELEVEGVPIVQSGANGQLYGRVDLVYSKTEKRVLKDRTRRYAGVALSPKGCGHARAQDYCQVSEAGVVSLEGEPVVSSAAVASLIAAERVQIQSQATEVIATAQATVSPNRIDESPLANALTDAVRLATGADLALMNAGGIRSALPQGEVTYEVLYRVLPFNNRLVIMGPMTVETLLVHLRRTIQTCGAFGSMMQSGLRVEFTRDCTRAVNGLDPQATLHEVRTASGDLLFREGEELSEVARQRTFRVATLDFLAAGGSGFSELGSIPVLERLGIARELIVGSWRASHPVLSGVAEGRWRNRLGSSSTRRRESSSDTTP